jgi:hypothetical protein
MLRLFPLLILFLAGVLVYEGYRAYGYYNDLSAGSERLERIEPQISYDILSKSEAEVIALREELSVAGADFAKARQSIDDDRVLDVLERVPDVDDQVVAFRILVRIADDAVRAGLDASDVLLAYVRQRDGGGSQSLNQQIVFLASQQTKIIQVRAAIEAIKAERAKLPPDLMPPLEDSVRRIDAALESFDSLLSDYERFAYAAP